MMNIVGRPVTKVSAAFVARRHMSIPSTLQKFVWKKSTINYITFVMVGLIATEFVYGKVTNYIWESYNHGKLYHQIDWSKFKTEDDE